MSSRKVILSLVTLITCGLAFGQEREKVSLKDWVMDLITAPSPSYNPASVYQPAPQWSVAVSGNLRRAGASQKNEFTVQSLNDSYTFASLQGGVDKTVGLHVGYGNLSLGYNQKVGGNKEYVNKTYSFDYMLGGAAFQLQYFDFRQPIDYEMRVGEPVDWFHQSQSGRTEKPGRMRAFIADMLYSFNNRTFAYSAVYKGGKIQCHSAGSWMFGAKYNQGTVEHDPGEDLSSWVSGLARQTTRQVSFGGGFSYNYVPLHRQPHEDSWEGFRNLTINVTAVPMATIFNQFSSVMYERTPDGGYQEGARNTMNGKLLANYVFRAGAIYSWNNYSAAFTASYDSYSYTGKSSIEYDGSYYQGVTSTGHFARWMMGLEFRVKF